MLTFKIIIIERKKGSQGIAPRVLILIWILTLFLHPPQGVWGTKSPKVFLLKRGLKDCPQGFDFDLDFDFYFIFHPPQGDWDEVPQGSS
ncbi:MAG: hypothetical protein HQL83_07945 [Magnetococcales bacterium]|nr:hypothetical protein [Magnetococcales bacterium]